jgi:hypothetical protein
MAAMSRLYGESNLKIFLGFTFRRGNKDFATFRT